MGKRGPKKSRTSIQNIAKCLGVDPRTIKSVLRKALIKLRDLDDVELILATVHAVEEPTSIIRCCSVECDRDFIRLYGDVDKKEKYDS